MDNNFKRSFISELSWSAIEYFKIGIRFIDEREKYLSSTKYRVAIGNMSIAIELMLKSYLVEIHPLTILTGIPEELRLYLLNEENEIDGINFYKYIKIMNHKLNLKTIELQKVVSMFLKYESNVKQELNNYLRKMIKLRNESIHGTNIDVTRIEFEKIAYLTIKIFEKMSKHEYFKQHRKLIVNKKIDSFIKQYDKNLIDNLDKKVEKAKTNTKGTAEKKIITILSSLSEYVINCPICNNSAILGGYTDGEKKDEQYPEETDLVFYAETFKCEFCGLSLDDYEELLLLDIDTVLDNNDSFGEWLDNYYDSFDY